MSEVEKDYARQMVKPDHLYQTAEQYYSTVKALP